MPYDASPERGDEGEFVGAESRFQSVVTEPNDFSLRAWMSLAGQDIGGYEWISKDDLRQRFALSHYIRMHETENVGDEELQNRFVEDAITYVEENVLRVKLGQREFELRDGDMYSAGFESKSILSMCRDTVVARQEKGINPERAKHEGLGFANLVKLLEVMSPGEVVVLVSPPDKNNKNMCDYSMAYVYEKGENGKIWFGAVRDEHRAITAWQDFARENSLWQTDWTQYDHLKFVALPFVAKEGLGQILKRLGVGRVAEMPEWIRREAEVSAKLIVANITSGNRDLAQRVLDSFKMAVIAGREKKNPEHQGYRVSEMVIDPRYWMMVRDHFWNSGGDDVLAAGGICGADLINGLNGGYMDPLRQIQKDNNLMSKVTGVDESSVTTTSSDDEVKVDMHCGLCCGSHVVKKGSYYVCKNPSCGGKIECSKIDKN